MIFGCLKILSFFWGEGDQNQNVQPRKRKNVISAVRSFCRFFLEGRSRPKSAATKTRKYDFRPFEFFCRFFFEGGKSKPKNAATKTRNTSFVVVASGRQQGQNVPFLVFMAAVSSAYPQNPS